MARGRGGLPMAHLGTLLVSITAGACSNRGLADCASPPTLADLPKAPGASLAAERTTTRPPVKAGDTRIAQFDIDVALPADAVVYQNFGSASILWSGCYVDVRPALLRPQPQLQGGPRVVRRVGTFELACVAGPWARNAMDPQVPPDPKCLAICDHMTAVPGSTAEERYPTDPPVIESERQGGLFYRYEGMLVWRDGTVQYHGSKCRTWRGRRATLAPARVAAVLAAVEHGGFFAYHRNDARSCSDAIYGTVTVRGAAGQNSLDVNECDRSGLSTFVHELEQAIGSNPCSSP